MKKIFFITVILLLAQTVFAGVYEDEFVDKFTNNDMTGIEKLLKEHGHQMDLQICLNSVCHSLAWLTMGKNPESDSRRQTDLPLNRNRNSIFKSIQLLVNSGADLNQFKYKGLYTGNVDSKWSLYYGDPSYSSILYRAIKENSQPNMAIIKFLLESGADPNPTNEYGYPCGILYNAIDQGNVALVKLLVDAGCKIDETDFISNLKRYPKGDYIGSISTLQFATYLGEYAIVKTLVEAGAKISYVQKDHSTRYLSGKTSDVIAKERGETDIYNFLQSKQIASAPTPSSQPRQTYNDNYDYSPPPSSSSSSSTPSRNTGREVADSISRAFESPLESGRYRISGRLEEFSFAGIAKSGMVYFKDATGKQYQGNYSIDGERLTINVMNRSFFYSITSKTSFSGHGEAWYRVGY